MARRSTPPGLAAAVIHGDRAALVGHTLDWVGPVTEAAQVMDQAHRRAPTRWVWWSARSVSPLLRTAPTALARAWDLAEAHRVLHGGWEADPAYVWASAHGIPTESMPAQSAGDLFDFSEAHAVGRDELTGTDGHLRPDLGGDWLSDDAHLRRWAHAALTCAERQREQADQISPRVHATIHAESAAAVLCIELERDGLPVDRAVLESLIVTAAGEHTAHDSDTQSKRTRDEAVLRHVPGRENTDLRNPQQVKDMLAAVGVQVPSTRKGVLEPYRHVHPVVDALLTWRKAERIATTYGWRWLEHSVGPDDRLRGEWSACDGAAGRMTAGSGLHNLPAALRSAVVAHPGQVFIRSDLGQIEPRVLAVVSGDPAFAAATLADDLYAPVAARLGVERAVAKVAVLAAMYGARSGAAAQALQGLERAYPVAMGVLDRAYAAGQRGEPVRTFGGRLIPTGRLLTGPAIGADPDRDAARGRFARNAIIQGAAAELFKAWAATVRALVAPWGAQIVLCLHDELLVHAPAPHAEQVARAVDEALAAASSRWAADFSSSPAGTPTVRFVADTSIITRWSDAKD